VHNSLDVNEYLVKAKSETGVLKGALQLLAIGKFALVRYLSEFRFQVRPAIYPGFTRETRNNSEQVIEESKLKPSFIMSHSTKVMSTV